MGFGVPNTRFLARIDEAAMKNCLAIWGHIVTVGMHLATPETGTKQ